MAREWPPNFTGYWEGEIEYTCDECRKGVSFEFDSEEECYNSKAHRKSMRDDFGWITAKVNDKWKDFCSESCKNSFIRKHTF